MSRVPLPWVWRPSLSPDVCAETSTVAVRWDRPGETELARLSSCKRTGWGQSGPSDAVLCGCGPDRGFGGLCSLRGCSGEASPRSSPVGAPERIPAAAQLCPMDSPRAPGHSLLPAGGTVQIGLATRVQYRMPLRLEFGAIFSHRVRRLLSKAFLVRRSSFCPEAFSLARDRQIRSPSPGSPKAGLPGLRCQLSGAAGGNGRAHLSWSWSQLEDKGTDKWTQPDFPHRPRMRCLLENTRACSSGAPFPMLAPAGRMGVSLWGRVTECACFHGERPDSSSCMSQSTQLKAVPAEGGVSLRGAGLWFPPGRPGPSVCAEELERAVCGFHTGKNSLAPN